VQRKVMRSPTPGGMCQPPTSFNSYRLTLLQMNTAGWQNREVLALAAGRQFADPHGGGRSQEMAGGEKDVGGKSLGDNQGTRLYSTYAVLKLSQEIT
jgi:hypothetical protein